MSEEDIKLECLKLAIQTAIAKGLDEDAILSLAQQMYEFLCEQNTCAPSHSLKDATKSEFDKIANKPHGKDF